MARMVPKRTIEDIRFRTDIVELIGSYIDVKRAGSTFKALCPFHKEKTPSFNINVQRQIYHCFGCGAGGDVFGFLMQYEGLDFTSAVRMLAERAGIVLELEEGEAGSDDKPVLFKIHEGLANFYRRCLNHSMRGADRARAYLAERELPEDVVEAFAIGYAPDRWDATITWGEKNGFTVDQLELAGVILKNPREDARHSHYDRFRDRLMFPIRDEQRRVVGFSGRALNSDQKGAKYVNSPETPLFHKSRLLYALDLARRPIVDAGEAIVCEGQIDVIRCHSAGFTNAIAAQGTAFTEEHSRIVKRYADGVVLVFDPDTAGQDAAIKTARIFMQAGLSVRIAQLPNGEDPDTFIRARGAEAFRGVLDRALSSVAFQVDVLSGREDAKSEVGIMRITRAVLESINHSGNAVQRSHMLQEASELLRVPASALRDELQRLKAPAAPRVDPSTPDFTEPEAIVRPAYEVMLCEHLVHIEDAPALSELVREYLPLDMLRDPLCRRLAAACLKAYETGESIQALLAGSGDMDADTQRFAALVQSAPCRTRGTEVSRDMAVRDLILKIWSARIREERETLTAGPATPEGNVRRQQITLDLHALKNWEDGAAVIEMELASREAQDAPDLNSAADAAAPGSEQDDK